MWETLLEMKRFTYHAGERDQGATALVLDFAKASERVSLCGMGNAFPLSQKQNTCALMVLRTPADGAFRRLCGKGAPDHHGHSLWVKVELLAPAHCVAGHSE